MPELPPAPGPPCQRTSPPEVSQSLSSPPKPPHHHKRRAGYLTSPMVLTQPYTGRTPLTGKLTPQPLLALAKIKKEKRPQCLPIALQTHDAAPFVKQDSKLPEKILAAQEVERHRQFLRKDDRQGERVRSHLGENAMAVA